MNVVIGRFVSKRERSDAAILAGKLASSVKAGFLEHVALRHHLQLVRASHLLLGRLAEGTLLTLVRHLLGVLSANEMEAPTNPPRGRVVIARGFGKERVHILREFVCGWSARVR